MENLRDDRDSTTEEDLFYESRKKFFESINYDFEKLFLLMAKEREEGNWLITEII